MPHASRPAVDFFLRNLTYEFARDDIVGLPGSMIGLEEPLQDDRLIGFLHEAEHITQLMYPLGTLMTALGVRVLDLRNDAARIAANRDFLSLARAIDRYGDCIYLIRQLAEWVKPLMEGLALVAEMELDPIAGDELSRGFAAALFLEAAQWRQALAPWPDGLEIIRAIDAGEIDVVEDIRPNAEKQIEAGRALRRDGDMIDDVFWDTGGDGTLPYFTGYLFFKRVEQQWRRRSPWLTPREVHGIATVAFCSALPMAILPFLDDDIDVATKRPSYQAAAAMEYLIEGVPELSLSNLAMLSTPNRFVRFDGSRNVVPLADTTEMDGVQQLATLIGEIAVRVFGAGDRERSRQTAQVLTEIEYAKPIVPATARKVIVLAMDEARSMLLLIDAVDRNPKSLTFFECDAEALAVFAEKSGADPSRLPRVRMGEAPYRLSVGTAPWTLVLGTYLHFWPEGIRDGEALRPFRMLVSRGGERLYEAGTAEDDIESRRVRDFVNVRYHELVGNVIDDRLTEPAALLDRLDLLVRSDIEDAVAKRMREIYAPSMLTEIRENIRGRISRIVFGGEVDDARIRSERWSIVARDLSNDDVAVLRRAMRNGLVFSRDNFAPAAPSARDAVARIRQAALRRLGIPLVRWCESPPGIALDVLPA